MDSARWDRVQALFHSAADLSPSERAAFLRGACGDDHALIADVAAMLEEDSRASLLDRSVAQVASDVIGNSISLPMQQFGPYRIKNLLGEGGMGVVYLAEREDLGSLVAIKILRNAWMSPARRDRFAREQRTLAQLNHSYIARLYDADTLPDGTPWFVMEYVDGLPLTEHCNANRLALEERLKLFRMVCEAVQYAHECGVIHRDLKPSNILVKRDGSVRLLDFGIAKQLDPGGGSVDQTRTAFRLMTPAYGAPEQLRGGQSGIHTDVYSLGVILYELLAGRLPFDVSNKTPAEAAEMIALGQPAKPSAAAGRPGATGRPETSKASWGDLDALCLTAMHNDSERRYRSVEAVIRDLDHYLNHEPLEARPDSLLYRLSKFVRRNWQLASASTVMLVVAIVAVALTLGPGRNALPASPKVKTVGVLPLQNVGPDRSLDYLRLAIADQIATTLSYMHSISVRPFATTSKFTGADLDPQQAGREMRVGTIVTGHFLKAGEQLEITLEAVDVESNRLLWRDTVAVGLQNMIAMQTLIAARARGGLAPLFGSPGFAPETAAQPRSEEAYDLYLRSTAVPFDRGVNQQALGMLERAVGLDPAYAPAWFALARRYYVEGHYGTGGAAMMKRYDAATERALALDPDSTAAVAGQVLSRAERGELIKAYREAVDLVRRHPDSADAQFGLSYVLRYAGLLEEAASHCESAFSLDAQTQFSGVKSCAIVFVFRGDYKRALDFIRLDGGSDWARAVTLHALVRQAKEKDALEARPARPAEWSGFGLLTACLEHRPAGEISALAARLRPVDDPELNYFSADHLAYCGETAAAFEMLKQAVQGNYCSYPEIDSDPFLAGLRSRPEFAEIRSMAVACQKNFLAQRVQLRTQ